MVDKNKKKLRSKESKRRSEQTKAGLERLKEKASSSAGLKALRIPEKGKEGEKSIEAD